MTKERAETTPQIPQLIGKITPSNPLYNRVHSEYRTLQQLRKTQRIKKRMGGNYKDIETIQSATADMVLRLISDTTRAAYEDGALGRKEWTTHQTDSGVIMTHKDYWQVESDMQEWYDHHKDPEHPALTVDQVDITYAQRAYLEEFNYMRTIHANSLAMALHFLPADRADTAQTILTTNFSDMIEDAQRPPHLISLPYFRDNPELWHDLYGITPEDTFHFAPYTKIVALGIAFGSRYKGNLERDTTDERGVASGHSFISYGLRPVPYTDNKPDLLKKVQAIGRHEGAHYLLDRMISKILDLPYYGVITTEFVASVLAQDETLTRPTTITPQDVLRNPHTTADQEELLYAAGPQFFNRYRNELLRRMGLTGLSNQDEAVWVPLAEMLLNKSFDVRALPDFGHASMEYKLYHLLQGCEQAVADPGRHIQSFKHLTLEKAVRHLQVSPYEPKPYGHRVLQEFIKK